MRKNQNSPIAIIKAMLLVINAAMLMARLIFAVPLADRS
jgi:hypothetical protein